MRVRGLMLSLLAAAMSMLASRADAATLKTIHDFCGAFDCAGGVVPTGGVTMDASGTLYGATYNGGPDGYGTVYALTPNGDGTWTHQVVHTFCSEPDCADGGNPTGHLVLDTNGALYGVTNFGGKGRVGSIFRLSPNADRTKWKLKTLYSFCTSTSTPTCDNGYRPNYGLAYLGQKDGKLYDGATPLYGLASGGKQDDGSCFGGGCGVLYRIYPRTEKRWAYSVLYRFCPKLGSCTDGWQPLGQLVVANATTLLGTAMGGGAHQHGAVFKLVKAKGAPTWNESLAYSFCPQVGCGDGGFPSSGVALAKNGYIWGGAQGGGNVPGTLFKIAPNGTESTVFLFCSTNCPDGGSPTTVAFNAAGEVFGITTDGGGNDGGVIYKQSGSTHTTLYRFCSQANCTDGENPSGPLTFAANGKIYGATQYGGANHGGTVYELTP
ncbi:MAG: hypothetical protein JOZ72_14300 [Alphaproteobacteria bacterium]|nr:hypothetical protein [Alphaproteobacteria bacterium]